MEALPRGDTRQGLLCFLATVLTWPRRPRPRFPPPLPARLQDSPTQRPRLARTAAEDASRANPRPRAASLARASPQATAGAGAAACDQSGKAGREGPARPFSNLPAEPGRVYTITAN